MCLPLATVPTLLRRKAPNKRRAERSLGCSCAAGAHAQVMTQMRELLKETMLALATAQSGEAPDAPAPSAGTKRARESDGRGGRGGRSGRGGRGRGRWGDEQSASVNESARGSDAVAGQMGEGMAGVRAVGATAAGVSTSAASAAGGAHGASTAVGYAGFDADDESEADDLSEEAVEVVGGRAALEVASEEDEDEDEDECASVEATRRVSESTRPAANLGAAMLHAPALQGSTELEAFGIFGVAARRGRRRRGRRGGGRRRRR
eukprot:3471536-Prymnesium_polylepis.1